MKELSECLYDKTGAVALNPVSGIQLISLLTVGMDDVRNAPPELLTLIMSMAASINLTLPVREDVVGAVNALARLQLTYNISVRRVSEGHFFSLHRTEMPSECARKLRPSAFDCALIAKAMKTHQPVLVQLSKSWMSEAIRLSERGGHVPLIDAVRLHATGVARVSKSLKELIDQADANPDFDLKEAVTQLLAVDESALWDLFMDAQTESGWDHSWNEYIQLCQNSIIDTYISDEQRHQLLCGYAILGHAYFLIGPVKTEWVSFDPEVRVYYDVLSDKEIAMIQTLAKQSVRHDYLRD